MSELPSGALRSGTDPLVWLMLDGGVVCVLLEWRGAGLLKGLVSATV
jgi:hypothetical protein